MKIKPHRFPGFAIAIIFLLARQAVAQISVSPNSDAVITNAFGSPAIRLGVDPAGYLSLGAKISSYEGSMQDISKGKIIFVQKKSRLPDWFPAPKGEFIALASDTGYIHIFNGSNIEPATASMRDSSFELSIFDRGRRSWVNPAFFAKGLIDTQAPKINALALEKDGIEYDFKDARNARASLRQGRYSLLTSITDTNVKYSSSGVLRVKAMLDGMSALDGKLDMAAATMEGLSFLGRQAPSSNVIGKNDKIMVGEIVLMRGEHTLEIFAYDFAGNEAAVSWKLNIE